MTDAAAYSPFPVEKRRALLDRLWANALRSAPPQVDAVRSRLLVFCSLLSLLVNATYAVMLIGTSAWRESGIALLTFAVLVVVFSHAWRNGWRRWSAHLYCYSGVISLALYLLVHKEVDVTVAIWFPFIPMLALLLLERREGIVVSLMAWAVLSSLAVGVAGGWSRMALSAQWPLVLSFGITTAAAVGVMLVYIRLRDLVLAQQRRDRDAKEALLRILCHDIANHMAIIRLSATRSTGSTAQTTTALTRIREAAEGIIEMVQTVRSMAVLEAGKVPVQLAPVDSAACARRVIDLLDPRAAAKNLTITAQFPDTPLYVWADRVYLENTIWANLLANAIKFTPRGGRITVTVESGGADNVCCSVADTGIGIPPDQLLQLFDPGRHTHREGTEGEPGTGFGLPLVKTFVEHFGGTIAVKTEPRTCFAFTLRQAPPPPPEPPESIAKERSDLPAALVAGPPSAAGGRKGNSDTTPQEGNRS